MLRIQSLVKGAGEPLVKGDRAQVSDCPPGLVKGAGDPSEVYADLLRLCILHVNVMLGVVTWTGSNMDSIVFQTEVRERGCVSRIPGKVLE